MTAEEMAQTVQYTVDSDGNVTAVVVAPALWKRILDELEDVEDRELVHTLRNRLGAHPQKWALPWSDVADKWS
jgi:hypothetical protein